VLPARPLLTRRTRWRNRRRVRRCVSGRSVYNYFRDYDAVTGRYVQSDPIGLDGGLNTYLYADANPLAYIDPYGLAKRSTDAAIEQAVLRGDVNQLRFLLKEVNYLSRAEQDALLRQCASNIPDKIGTIASNLGRSEREIARAIELVKQRGLPRGVATEKH
jgi:RHS repeat-associated protein